MDTIFSLGRKVTTEPQSTTWAKINPDSTYDVVAIGDSLLFVTTYNNGLEFSSDNGSNWIKKNLSPTSNPLTKLSVNNSSGSIFVFSAGDHEIYKSTNEGDIWGASLSVNGSIVDLISKKGNLYAISDSGDFYLSTNDGNIWDSSYFAHGLSYIDVGSTGEIFVGPNHYSNDNGKTWQSFNMGAYDIAIDSKDNIIVCSYDYLKVSKDLGSTWEGLIVPGLIVYMGYSYKSKLSVDNLNSWYLNGDYILKSTNNGKNWISLGSVYANRKVKVFENNLYIASPNGLYKYDPSVPIYIGSNYFPLKVGNKWQFISYFYSDYNGTSYAFQQVEVVKDTLVNSQKYFKVQGFDYNDRWIRYSEHDKKVYIRSGDSEAVFMDFNLPVNSTFNQVSNFKTISTQTKITEGSSTFFGNTVIYKGYSAGCGVQGYHYQNFGENIGPIYYRYTSYGPGNYATTSDLINAIIYDSTNTPIYYSNHYEPKISLTPRNEINTDTLKLNFSVTHQYLSSTNVTFLDKVYMISYYSNNDLKINYDTVYAYNIPKTENYILSSAIDTSLLKSGFIFNYKIVAMDKNLIPEFSSSPDSGYYQCVWDNSTSVDDNENHPLSFKLEQNYPNPFNPTTTINYEIPITCLVNIKIYDLLGREIETLINEDRSPGKYKIEFNGHNLANGIYFYRIISNSYTETRKLLLIK